MTYFQVSIFSDVFWIISEIDSWKADYCCNFDIVLHNNQEILTRDFFCILLGWKISERLFTKHAALMVGSSPGEKKETLQHGCLLIKITRPITSPHWPVQLALKKREKIKPGSLYCQKNISIKKDLTQQFYLLQNFSCLLVIDNNDKI